MRICSRSSSRDLHGLFAGSAVSTFPVMHERRRRHGPPTFDEVVGWCASAGLPAPVSARVSEAPLQRGVAGRRLSRRQIFDPTESVTCQDPMRWTRAGGRRHLEEAEDLEDGHGC